MEGPTGVPMWSEAWRQWYYDALRCTRCGCKARAGGCGNASTCPLAGFRGAGLPGMRPWESNHPLKSLV